jgi:hypothetical protein
LGPTCHNQINLKKACRAVRGDAAKRQGLAAPQKESWLGKVKKFLLL